MGKVSGIRYRVSSQEGEKIQKSSILLFAQLPHKNLD